MNKTLDTPTLLLANEASVRESQSRTLNPKLVQRLDPEGTHLIAYQMAHLNDIGGTPAVRAKILCKVVDTDDPVEAWFDFNMDDYTNLSNR